MVDTPPLADFADKAGISLSYASELLNGKRTPSTRMAIDVYRRTGQRLGRIVELSEADIDALDRLTPYAKRRAPQQQAA